MLTSSSDPKQHEDFIAKFKERLFDVVESNPKLDSLIENLEEALKESIPVDLHASVAAAAFNYALDVTLQQAIPVFLTLLVEEDMDFVKELSNILEVNWVDTYKLMRRESLN